MIHRLGRSGIYAIPMKSHIHENNSPSLHPLIFTRFQSSSSEENSGIPNKVSLMHRVKEGALHYWQGTKLLAYETKTSSGLVLKLLRGDRLIRREYRQLLRTTSDLFRLVPFVIILIVPFLEFALPVLLKFFPNMLPSTFEDRLQSEEKVKKQLKVKIEMAKFLQDVTESMASRGSQGTGFRKLYERTKNQKIPLSSEEIVEVCRSLSEDITLDNLPRPQLLSLCKYMTLNAIGTDTFLRYQIRRAMGKLKQDDVMIDEEGIDSLHSDELKAACNVRGIRTISVSEEYMKRELGQWIELHVKHAIPAPILVLSRAFALTEYANVEEALRATVASLPEQVISEAQIASGSDVFAEEKLRSLKKQGELIQIELEQEQAPAAENESRLTDREIESLSEAVVTLASDSPVVLEKEELKEIVDEQRENQESIVRHEDKATANLLRRQIDKLIIDISEDIDKFEEEIGKRLQIISASYDGSISAAQLKAVFKLLKNSPRDAQRIANAIKTFDSDQDGKIFIEDLKKLAFEAENREGHGILIEGKKVPKREGADVKGQR